MCIDFTNLNKACPKNSYPLPSIDSLVDSAPGCQLLSFLDAFSGYNHIGIHLKDESKTSCVWTKECEEAYTKLKEYLASPPVLSKPILGVPTSPRSSVSEKDLKHRRQRKTSNIGHRCLIVMVGHVRWALEIISDTSYTPKYKRRPKSREDHAWGVYGTFGYDTSKCSLEALRPVRVRVSRERLHAWHVNT